jgi:hypothetical protein
VWELTPHNDSIVFEVLLQIIGASSKRVIRSAATCAAADGKVQGSLRCDSGGRYVYPCAIISFSVSLMFRLQDSLTTHLTGSIDQLCTSVQQ